MRLEFTNVYHTENSIIIKKEDARTGNPLAGATFRLLQDGQPLSFTYHSDTNQYFYDPDGAVTELSGSTSGYYELIVSGFSYDKGDVVVQELKAPSGYTPIENITLGYVTDPDTGQLTDEVDILSASPLADYHDGLLIIGNSTEDTSVTVSKRWLCPEADWAEVTVQLLANGQLVSSLIPGVSPTVLLNAGNGYRATWSGLPAYANGQLITWSVREVRIGSENCKADFTFANWLVSYSAPTYTKDASGRVTNTSFTVENDTRRTLLRVFKVNPSGSIRLPGATFTLQHLISDGRGGYTADPNFAQRMQTTGADGTLTFENILYGYYRLQETSPPGGYELLIDPIYLTLREDGTVVVDPHIYASPGSAAYSIQVANIPHRPLPHTGGTGPGIYGMLGAALLLCAACGYLLPRIRKKGRYGSG
jgi:LPXTG-motif cell wall-anchored protein